MRRALGAFTAVLATFAIATAALAATGTKKPATPPVITAVTGYSDGSGGGFCNFRVVVRYRGTGKHDALRFYLTTGPASGDSAGTSLGPSPATAAGGFSPPPQAGTYHFLVRILDSKGNVLSHAKTSTFALTGACPAAGTLGTYKRPRH